MTHERTEGAEPQGGPEHDSSLPNAWEVPVAEGPHDLPAVAQPDEWDDEDEEDDQ